MGRVSPLTLRHVHFHPNLERSTMRHLIATAVTASALMGTAPASAQQAQTIHYSGGFNCGKDEYATDWKIR